MLLMTQVFSLNRKRKKDKLDLSSMLWGQGVVHLLTDIS